MPPQRLTGKRGNYADLQFMRGRWSEKTHQSDKAATLGCTYGCLRGKAAEQTPALMRPQTLIIRADTLDHTHTDLRVFGHPVPQHVEDSVRRSAADDEIFIAGPFGVCKNCWKDLNVDSTCP